MDEVVTEVIQTTLLGGKLQLLQMRAGHRSGTDAVLLAACIGEARGALYDFGAGAGAAGLAVGLRNPGCRVVLVEREPQLLAVATENVEINAMRSRAIVVQADILDPKSRAASGLKPGTADFVITNPPYQSAASSRISPDALKARAHTFSAGSPSGLEEWVRACASVLKPGGIFAMIHRADALSEVLAACGRRFGDLRLLPVHPRAGETASRILIRGIAGSRAPLVILPGLALHGDGHDFTAAAAALHSGETLLDFGNPKAKK